MKGLGMLPALHRRKVGGLGVYEPNLETLVRN